MENQHFNFGEKATITIDDILAIKNGEQVGFTVKGLASETNEECRRMQNFNKSFFLKSVFV